MGLKDTGLNAEEHFCFSVQIHIHPANTLSKDWFSETPASFQDSLKSNIRSAVSKANFPRTVQHELYRFVGFYMPFRFLQQQQYV